MNCLLNIYSSEDIHVPKENKNIYEENNYDINKNLITDETLVEKTNDSASRYYEMYKIFSKKNMA